jgi:hypothetical protein
MHNPNRPLISSAATGISGIVLVLIGARGDGHGDRGRHGQDADDR